MAIGRIPEPGTGIPESIVDAKGDIVTATAADTPARLAVGTNNQTLVAASGEATGLKYANGSVATLTAKGDLLTATAANTISRLGVGANGTTLVADSSEATGLKWATPAGGGKVLQVVSSSSSTTAEIYSTTYTDSNLSATITPSSASSKILVLITHKVVLQRDATILENGYVRLMRNASAVLSYEAALWFRAGSTADTALLTLLPITYLDSPSTTSAVTYKTQGKVEGTANSANIRFYSGAQIVLLEIGA
jgi:hypothetical protein